MRRGSSNASARSPPRDRGRDRQAPPDGYAPAAAPPQRRSPPSAATQRAGGGTATQSRGEFYLADDLAGRTRILNFSSRTAEPFRAAMLTTARRAVLENAATAAARCVPLRHPRKSPRLNYHRRRLTTSRRRNYRHWIRHCSNLRRSNIHLSKRTLPMISSLIVLNPSKSFRRQMTSFPPPARRHRHPAAGRAYSRDPLRLDQGCR